MISNDNWLDDAVSAAQLTANGLARPNQNESGIFASLPPGDYTAILAGENGGVGIGIEIIEGLRGHTTGYGVPQFVIDAPAAAARCRSIPVTFCIMTTRRS